MADESLNGPGRVLVVDDTEASRYAVARHLRQAGYSVEEAGTGQQAIAMVEEAGRTWSCWTCSSRHQRL